MKKSDDLSAGVPNREGAQIYIAPVEFTDPELSVLSSGLVEAGTIALRGLHSMSGEIRSGSGEQKLSQSDVDVFLKGKIGTEAFNEAAAAAEILRGLHNQKSKIIKSGDPENTMLSDGVSMILLNEKKGRDKMRRAHGSYITKAQKLVDYWESGMPYLPKSDLEQLHDTVLRPLNSIEDQGKKLKDEEETTIKGTVAFRNAVSEINSTTSLDVAKMLVFNKLINCFKQPVIIETYRQMFFTDESDPKFYDSKLAPIYNAVRFIEKLTSSEKTDHSDEAWQDEIRLLAYGHSKGRLLGMSSRKFKESHRELTELSLAYLRLNDAQEAINYIPKRIQATNKLLDALIKQSGSDAIFEFAKVRDESLESAAIIHNKRIKVANTGDEKSYEEFEKIREDTARLDDLCVAIGQQLMAETVTLGLDTKPSTINMLKALSTPSLRQELDKVKLQDQLVQLEPEIKQRLESFQKIDNNYKLSNNKLREREPRLLQIANQFRKALGESTAINEDTVRSLVGLMTGVYWESTKQDTEPTDLAKKYLEDAGQLRILASELEFLGQPQESKLLKLTNLLDELIDSGVFDDITKHPEFNEFTDFILEYIIARDGSTETVAAVDEVPINGNDTIENEPQESLPIETIRQATFEPITVFPPGISMHEVIDDYSNNIEKEDLPLVEWERIRKLIDFRDQCQKQGLEVNFMRTKHASWQMLPFFVLEVRLPQDDHAVAIIESPVYGNATYIFREAEDRLPWRDVVQLSRQEAREQGAVPAVHVDSKQLDKHFTKVWNRVISELTVLR
jgi:hypothetical protein